MLLSRGRRAALTLPFAASVCLALAGVAAPAEGSYGVWRGGRGAHLVTLDPEGNRTSTQTPKGPTTTFEYDELGKLRKVIQPPPNPLLDPTPLVTEYAYDENRNRVLQTDANRHAVKMEYDELNRLKKTTQDPDGLNLVTETTRFDANGNPEEVGDPKGQKMTSTFDELNRLKTKSYAFAPGDPVRPWRYTASLEYGYDENGNLRTTDEHVASGTSPPDTTLSTSRTYDRLDRLESETQPLPDGGSRTIGYTYHRNGLRKTVTDPAGSVTQYTYDGQNRLETAVTGFGTADAKTTAYTYWPDDLLKTVTYPNGVVASHGYDKADRLLTLANAKGATPVSSYTYSYDPNGNRLTQVEVNGGRTETTGYTYDDLDRLASVTYPVDAAYPQGRVVTYGYDAVGNRIRETEKDSADALLADKQGIFDHANRLTELQDLVTPAQSTSFTWDSNGNQLTKTIGGTTTEYRYDLRDKLVEVVQGPSTLGRFQYDADGRRSLKIGEEGLRQYIYDQTSLLTEYDAAGLQKAKYDYGSERLISLTRADEPRRYFSLDGLRSVVNLTDDLGNVAASYHLSVWGEYRFPTELDASRNRFGFTGHLFDTEIQLYAAKARYFDPKLGRFLTQDAYLGQIDEPPSLHRYLYANANPTTFVDPTGHQAKKTDQPPGWLVAGMEFLERVGKVPDQIVEGLARRLTPGAEENQGKLAEQQRKLLGVAKNPKAPLVARVEAASEALKMQPAIAVEETVVRPVVEMPGHARAGAVHLAQAEAASNPVDKAVHLLGATKEFSDAFVGGAAPFALATGRAASAASVPDEALASRTLRLGEVVADDVAPRSAPITDPSRLLPAGSIDDVIAANYQRYYNEAASRAIARFNAGKITVPSGTNWRQVLGQRIDTEARNRLLNFLDREGIPEGPGTDVLVNRWLRDPSGSGRHRIPDVALPASRRILEGTIGAKTATSPQVVDFVTFSGGFNVELVRPEVPALRVR